MVRVSTNQNAEEIITVVRGDTNHGKGLIPQGYGYDPNIQRFIDHLNKAKAAYNKGK